jgi:uncharacterized lipoprotein YajG
MKKPLTRSLFLVGVASVLLAGCVTVQNSKTMTIRPTDAPVTVTSTARASCKDVFFVMWCRLNMAMESSNGEKVSDFRQ